MTKTYLFNRTSRSRRVQTGEDLVVACVRRGSFQRFKDCLHGEVYSVGDTSEMAVGGEGYAVGLAVVGDARNYRAVIGGTICDNSQNLQSRSVNNNIIQQQHRTHFLENPKSFHTVQENL